MSGPAKKKYDLAVKMGEKNGKGIWKNCGIEMEKPDGSRFLLIDPTFNFAAVPRGDNQSVIVSKFKAKEPGQQQGPPPEHQEEIPF